METAESISTTAPQTFQPERPYIDAFAGGIRLRWVYSDIEFAVDITRITDKATAEVTFYSSEPNSDRETLLLSTNRVDFLSTTHKSNLVKQLRSIGHTEDFISFCDWERKVNDIALAVIQNCRKDIPAVEVRIETDISLSPEYAIKPILYSGLPNIIFGDYASLKSITAMTLAYIVQLPYKDNGLGISPGRDTSTCCLWLDYEGQRDSFKRQWSAIQRGFMPDSELENIILYKEMTVPLADAVATVRDEMVSNRIEMVIVDSLGPAAGGNLNDPEPAIRYHEALRLLGGTSLTLAHNSKDPNTDSKSVFGSVFFSNLARSIWQCKAEKEPLENRATVSLKQIKASLSQLHATMGLCYDFDEDTNRITVTKTDLSDTSLAGDLPLSIRIRNLLRTGPMANKDIADALGARQESVKTTLNRLKSKGITVKIGDTWGLLENGVP